MPGVSLISKRALSPAGFLKSLTPLQTYLLAALALILALQLHLQFVQKINWDEFFYLSHIYDAQNDRLNKVLQMAHAYLFGILTQIPGGEIMQIRAGRIIMWMAQIITLVLIIRTARSFMSLTAALFSALCFVCIGFVFVHGTSFRADPLAAMLMMWAVYIFAASELRRRDLAGLSIALGLGALVTIKVVLFMPLFAAFAIWRLLSEGHKGRQILYFSFAALGAAAVFGLGYVLQASQLPPSGGTDSASKLASTAQTVFKSGGLFPRRGEIVQAIFNSPVPAAFLIMGFVMAAWAAFKRADMRKPALSVLALSFPLLSFVFYRNAYPYFFAFILPPAIVLCGYAFERLKLSNLMMGAICTIMVFNTAYIYKSRLSPNQTVQVQTLNAVHEIFPDPVAYFDRNGFVSSFPKAGFFMSSWGMRNYELKGEPVFTRELRQKTVPLLIDNSPHISAALIGEPTKISDIDAKALRENYIPHWGHIWVAGKNLITDPKNQIFNIAIPGQYTVEAQSSVIINGITHAPGETVNLSRGIYTYSSPQPQVATLRFGNNLKHPNQTPPDGKIFGGF